MNVPHHYIVNVIPIYVPMVCTLKCQVLTTRQELRELPFAGCPDVCWLLVQVIQPINGDPFIGMLEVKPTP